MIADDAKEEERRTAEGVASILANIEAEVEAKIVVVETDVTTVGGSESTNEGADGQTVIASTGLPSEQA